MSDKEAALLRELEQLRRVRRNYKGAGKGWPLPVMRHEDEILAELDQVRGKQA